MSNFNWDGVHLPGTNIPLAVITRPQFNHYELFDRDAVQIAHERAQELASEAALERAAKIRAIEAAIDETRSRLTAVTGVLHRYFPNEFVPIVRSRDEKRRRDQIGTRLQCLQYRAMFVGNCRWTLENVDGQLARPKTRTPVWDADLALPQPTGITPAGTIVLTSSLMVSTMTKPGGSRGRGGIRNRQCNQRCTFLIDLADCFGLPSSNEHPSPYGIGMQTSAVYTGLWRRIVHEGLQAEVPIPS